MSKKRVEQDIVNKFSFNSWNTPRSDFKRKHGMPPILSINNLLIQLSFHDCNNFIIFFNSSLGSSFQRIRYDFEHGISRIHSYRPDGHIL